MPLRLALSSSGNLAAIVVVRREDPDTSLVALVDLARRTVAGPSSTRDESDPPSSTSSSSAFSPSSSRAPLVFAGVSRPGLRVSSIAWHPEARGCLLVLSSDGMVRAVASDKPKAPIAVWDARRTRPGAAGRWTRADGFVEAASPAVAGGARRRGVGLTLGGGGGDSDEDGDAVLFSTRGAGCSSRSGASPSLRTPPSSGRRRWGLVPGVGRGGWDGSSSSDDDHDGADGGGAGELGPVAARGPARTPTHTRVFSPLGLGAATPPPSRRHRPAPPLAPCALAVDPPAGSSPWSRFSLRVLYADGAVATLCPVWPPGFPAPLAALDACEREAHLAGDDDGVRWALAARRARAHWLSDSSTQGVKTAIASPPHLFSGSPGGRDLAAALPDVPVAAFGELEVASTGLASPLFVALGWARGEADGSGASGASREASLAVGLLPRAVPGWRGDGGDADGGAWDAGVLLDAVALGRGDGDARAPAPNAPFRLPPSVAWAPEQGSTTLLVHVPAAADLAAIVELPSLAVVRASAAGAPAPAELPAPRAVALLGSGPAALIGDELSGIGVARLDAGGDERAEPWGGSLAPPLALAAALGRPTARGQRARAEAAEANARKSLACRREVEGDNAADENDDENDDADDSLEAPGSPGAARAAFALATSQAEREVSARLALQSRGAPPREGVPASLGTSTDPRELFAAGVAALSSAYAESAAEARQAAEDVSRELPHAADEAAELAASTRELLEEAARRVPELVARAERCRELSLLASRRLQALRNLKASLPLPGSVQALARLRDLELPLIERATCAAEIGTAKAIDAAMLARTQAQAQGRGTLGGRDDAQERKALSRPPPMAASRSGAVRGVLGYSSSDDESGDRDDSSSAPEDELDAVDEDAIALHDTRRALAEQARRLASAAAAVSRVEAAVSRAGI